MPSEYTVEFLCGDKTKKASGHMPVNTKIYFNMDALADKLRPVMEKFTKMYIFQDIVLKFHTADDTSHLLPRDVYNGGSLEAILSVGDEKHNLQPRLSYDYAKRGLNPIEWTFHNAAFVTALKERGEVEAILRVYSPTPCLGLEYDENFDFYE